MRIRPSNITTAGSKSQGRGVKRLGRMFTIRFPNGEIGQIPAEWLSGDFAPGTYKIKRRKVKFVEPTTEVTAEQLISAAMEGDTLEIYEQLLKKLT